MDENLEIREEFKEYESGTSGEALTKMITGCITKDWGLNIEFLCAQALFRGYQEFFSLQVV